MTRLLLFAPLKAPDHPTPSGDRTVGGWIVRALKRAGYEVELASRLRTRWRRISPRNTPSATNASRRRTG
jgi:hypothetical protein